MTMHGAREGPANLVPTKSERPGRERAARLFWSRIPVLLKRRQSLPGRGKACPGHPDYSCSVLKIRDRRYEPGDNIGMRFEAIEIRSSI